MTKRSYATSELLPHEDFLALDHYCEWLQDRGRVTLMQRLENLKCMSVEWNGHFGAHVFFDLAVEDDTPKRQRQIAGVIDAYMKRAARWRARGHLARVAPWVEGVRP